MPYIMVAMYIIMWRNTILTHDVMTLDAALSKLKLLTLRTPSATSVTTYLKHNNFYVRQFNARYMFLLKILVFVAVTHPLIVNSITMYTSIEMKNVLNSFFVACVFVSSHELSNSPQNISMPTECARK